MGIVTPSETIGIGDEFTINIYIDPSVKIGGWEIYLLSFSKDLVSANEVINGDEWPSTLFDEGDINNNNGTISAIQTWKTQDYPDYNHTACDISFTALAAGECTFKIISAKITNDVFEYISFTTHNATFVIFEEGTGNESVIENQDPVADASASSSSGLVGSIINFDGSLSSDDGTIESFYWEFGDGETGSGQKTTHIYLNSDTYTVKLTVTDNEGASDSVLIIVDIQETKPDDPPVENPNEGGDNGNTNNDNGDDPTTQNNYDSDDGSSSTTGSEDGSTVTSFDYIVGLELLLLVAGIVLVIFLIRKRSG
jgi:PKD repeat protein